MKIIKKSIILSAAFFMAALNAQTETQVDIQNKIAKVFDGFIPSQLTMQDKVLLDNLQLSITTLANTPFSQLSQEQETRKIQVLSLFCMYEENLRAKIELLATKIPLITEHIQHLQLQALNFLCEKVRAYCAQLKNNAPDKGFKFNNQELSNQLEKIIKTTLPKPLGDFEKLSCFRWINNSKILLKYLSEKKTYSNRLEDIFQYFSCNYSLLYSDLYKSYIKIIKQYREGNYAQLDEPLKTAIEMHEQKRQEIEDQLIKEKTKEEDLLKAQSIISLYLGKLLMIKNELLDMSLQQGDQADTIKVALLDRYTTIKANPKLEQALNNNTEFATLYNRVQKIISIIRANKELQQYTARELISTKERLQDFLKYNDISAIAKWNAKPDPTYLLVSQMAALLEDTCEYVFAKTNDQFIKDTITHSIVAPKTSKEEPVGPYQKILIETAERITGKSFSNIKDIALHVLSNASPSLTAYILSLVLPQLTSEAKQLITSLATKQDNQNPTEEPKEQKLIDMINQYLKEEQANNSDNLTQFTQPGAPALGDNKVQNHNIA